MRKKVILILTVLTLHLCSSQACAEDSKPFHIGVYIYDYQLKTTAQNLGEDYFEFLDKHLAILKSNGVNVVHLAVSKPDEFGEHLRLVKKYDIKLLPQLDFVYFYPPESDTAQEARAKRAAAFINKHLNDPSVLAWSIKEEVAHKDINRLAEYYLQILEHAPEAEFFTLHNGLGAAKDQPVPDPIISGTDRYAFWWEFSGGGYLASPAFALDWTRKQAAVYYEESAKRGADFMLVVTQGGMLMPKWANTLAKNPQDVIYPTTLDEQLAMQEKILKFADEGSMGWRKFTTAEGDFYNVWKYYRAPENSMKALAWISVLEGAKLFLTWHYEPYGNTDRQPDFEAAAKSGKHEIQYFTLAGRPGMDNPQLRELGEAAREIRSYEQIITQMAKIPECPVKTEDKNVHSNAFTFPGLAGKVIVIQNSNIGTWPANSRYRFNEDDPIQIDDTGNLVGYTPFTEAIDVHFSLKDKESDQCVYNLNTGTEIPADGGYKVSVMPGSGVLLYIGSAQDAEKLSRLDSVVTRSNFAILPSINRHGGSSHEDSSTPAARYFERTVGAVIPPSSWASRAMGRNCTRQPSIFERGFLDSSHGRALARSAAGLWGLEKYAPSFLPLAR